MRYPKIVTAVLLAFTALCLLQVPKVSIDGDLLRLYKNSGIHYDTYVEIGETFGTFENDAYLLVKSDQLTDPAVIETLREFALELELNSFARGTLSPFSLRKPALDDGATRPAVPENMANADEVAAALQDLRQNDPMMRNLIVEDLSGLVLLMFPDSDALKVRGEAEMISELRELMSFYEDPRFTIQLTGPPLWKAELLNASRSDQIKFTLSGIILGFLTAFLAFRTFWGAVLATLTPFISVVWVVGTVTMLFGSFTFLTNILTALVLVIAFAESMFFCFHWLRLSREGMEHEDAIRETIIRVSPACALTSITTIIAFLSLAIAPSQGVFEFAITGALAIPLAFLALVTFLPLALRAAIKLGYKPRQAPSVALTAIIPGLILLANKFGKPIAALAVVAFFAMIYPHTQLQPSFSFQQFLPKNSEAMAISSTIDEGVGGVAPLYIAYPLYDADPNVSDADFKRMETVHNVMQDVFGKGKVISAASFTHYNDAGFNREQIFDAVGPFMKKRFITDDATTAMATSFVPTGLSSKDVRELVEQTAKQLEDAGIRDAKITGFRVLSAYESVNMIKRLQDGLSIAVVLSIFIIGIAFRSWKVALICIIPNFAPILGTELYLWVSGAGLQLTTVISLTIAFGIAVDDTIHFMNHYVRARGQGLEHREAVNRTLDRVGPALIATTLILCAGTTVIIFSVLPQVALFGALCVLTLFLALLGDLIILPALLVAGGRMMKNFGGSK
ncbi:efflux RND transporter permease subunit [Maritalea porphyrae]|uniref:efflux RND transporter permease subunit n=1 Tax=Maritalea porphyrae TaxID=880732 RepID=UPI0022B03985|nr:efflux RND transporter permease subunit [Maritalea porphyrae]MCZ4273136.1 efflux RND transporter permease subunit [Maritalea porphyrae]